VLFGLMATRLNKHYYYYYNIQLVSDTGCWVRSSDTFTYAVNHHLSHLLLPDSLCAVDNYLHFMTLLKAERMLVWVVNRPLPSLDHTRHGSGTDSQTCTVPWPSFRILRVDAGCSMDLEVEVISITSLSFAWVMHVDFLIKLCCVDGHGWTLLT